MKNLSIVLFLFSSVVFSQDKKYEKKQSEIMKMYENQKANLNDLENEAIDKENEEIIKVEEQEFGDTDDDFKGHLPNSSEIKEHKKYIRDSGHALPGIYSKSDNYLEFKDKDVNSSFGEKGSTLFSMYFIKDNYTYQDSQNIFVDTFENGYKGIKAGFLMFSMGKYISRSERVNTLLGFNFGAGYNRAFGKFIDGAQSNTQIILYTIPLDATFNLEYNLGPYVKLMGGAGPSVLGLYQNRGDKDTGEKYKRRRQIGFGYMYQFLTKLSLSKIFPRKSLSMFDEYDVSQMTLDFHIRYNTYSKFQDEISISGTSIGAGFTFEYL